MKQKLPVIFAFVSFLILAALIIVGLVAPGNKTERSSRLFSSAAARDDKKTPEDESGTEPVPSAEASGNAGDELPVVQEEEEAASEEDAYAEASEEEPARVTLPSLNSNCISLISPQSATL